MKKILSEVRSDKNGYTKILFNPIINNEGETIQTDEHKLKRLFKDKKELSSWEKYLHKPPKDVTFTSSTENTVCDIRIKTFNVVSTYDDKVIERFATKDMLFAWIKAIQQNGSSMYAIQDGEWMYINIPKINLGELIAYEYRTRKEKYTPKEKRGMLEDMYSKYQNSNEIYLPDVHNKRGFSTLNSTGRNTFKNGRYGAKYWTRSQEEKQEETTINIKDDRIIHVWQSIYKDIYHNTATFGNLMRRLKNIGLSNNNARYKALSLLS